MVVEEPKFSHATYFFEIEEPLPISCQASSLAALTTVFPGKRRAPLLRGGAPPVNVPVDLM